MNNMLKKPPKALTKTRPKMIAVDKAPGCDYQGAKLKNKAVFLGMLMTLVIGLAVRPNSVQAAPAISEVSGTLEHGQNFTISGSGFGVKDPIEPLLYDTIDNQPAYAGLGMGDPIPIVEDGDCPDCPWVGDGAPHSMRPEYYDGQNIRVPGRPTYYVHKKGFFRGPDPFAQLDESAKVYMSWWIRANHNLYRQENDSVV